MHRCHTDMLASQKACGVGFQAAYPDRLAVQEVLEDFAKRFSLPANHSQTKLSGNETLLQVLC